MRKIEFKNGMGWKKVISHIYDKSGKLNKKVLLKEKDSQGDYSVILGETDHHLCFSNSITKRTSAIYPGNISIGIKHEFNDNKKEPLTYLFSNENIKTGRVENFELKDSKNLSYRSDYSKKISVYIPNDYDGTTPYDVLYFFDAQNLFSNAGKYTDKGDPYGSWQLDIVLSELHRQHGTNIIVVGIDNADEYRSHELFMNPADFGELSVIAKNIPNDDFSKGYLDRLLSFMVNTLHNFIKERYCIKEDNIGIGGSSMGGIAAFYCGIKELGFYKYVLSYSPAFGLYKLDAFDNYFRKLNFIKNKEILPKIHIYCGGGDSLEKMLLPSAKKMKPLMEKHGYPENLIFETFDKRKKHNEESWRLILPESFSLLL